MKQLTKSTEIIRKQINFLTLIETLIFLEEGGTTHRPAIVLHRWQLLGFFFRRTCLTALARHHLSAFFPFSCFLTCLSLAANAHWKVAIGGEFIIIFILNIFYHTRDIILWSLINQKECNKQLFTIFMISLKLCNANLSLVMFLS